MKKKKDNWTGIDPEILKLFDEIKRISAPPNAIVEIQNLTKEFDFTPDWMKELNEIQEIIGVNNAYTKTIKSAKANAERTGVQFHVPRPPKPHMLHPSDIQIPDRGIEDAVKELRQLVEEIKKSRSVVGRGTENEESGARFELFKKVKLENPDYTQEDVAMGAFEKNQSLFNFKQPSADTVRKSFQRYGEKWARGKRKR